MHRRTVLGGMAAAAALPALGLGARQRASAAPEDLRFDPKNYDELTTTITTDEGDRTVVYHFYRAVTYVADPVDAKYQCLNVSVPVRINGNPVDATRAPVLLANAVGGYMPSSVADATGIGGGGPAGAPPPEAGGPSGGQRVSNPELALAAGYVVVEPGARGRTLVAADGTYYGVAPAAIVDLKAAVRYVRYNHGRIPGDVERIVTSGTSAGGALSALLGATGDSGPYRRHLDEIGAADASDAVFASGDWCPITDLEHADMAYEWNWGGNPLSSGELVDRTVSRELAAAFTGYQASLGLHDEHGRITAHNYDEHLLRTYLRPAASAYLGRLSEADRADYLAEHPRIRYSGGQAEFGWQEYLEHAGARKKSAPAFDAFDISSPENNLFGAGTTEARHFTQYSLRHTGGDHLAGDLPATLRLMNPMPFLAEANPGRARHWWVRVGTEDTDTALTIVGNLAAQLRQLGDDVDAAMYWDAGHATNEDAGAFIRWIGQVTGYRS
ncbi:subtype B tannase [Saccharopolyspora halophila]|uniref:Subtype B tannase n=1 Tax=Saccharopolyspora halophila TaxID=405551 RepID=A0ABP5TTN3_9PSEU